MAILNKKIIWLDLGDLATFHTPNITTEMWQDHGLGILRTILHTNNLMTDIASLRTMTSWDELAPAIAAYDMLLMNVRSYTFPFAYRAAKIFKEICPNGIIIVGGMHATVALAEMESVKEFDHICSGGGENTICDIVRDPDCFPRTIKGITSKSLDDWPMVDRRLWPNPKRSDFPWPLEPSIGWGPSPMATIITSRVCPWQCSFCNEASYIPNMGRRSVDQVIAELNFLDQTYGPLGSVVIHDSMFFQHPSWLEEWLEKYPKHANKVWPYWASGRADTVRKWPKLFEALVRETNWNVISLGFESGSDQVLKMLNKGCTVKDNAFSIRLLNRIGDDFVSQGKKPPMFWANLIFATPGERPEDAFDTVRMLAHMKYKMQAIAYFAPYPGSALGNQLIAEGKSLMSRDNYHRYPGVRKLKGIDYQFYDKLFSHHYDDEISNGMSQWGSE